MNDSAVAEHHRGQRQQAHGDHDRRYHCLLQCVAGVDAVRYTDALDDVRADVTYDYYVHWHDDPDQRDCSVYQTLLEVNLHNASLYYDIVKQKKMSYKSVAWSRRGLNLIMLEYDPNRRIAGSV